ncbi:hypothetical protein [Nisaea sediminum]|uniref:hypothetical protein n=1 Tax=Nisaea sediminum TaxID=2775867 RepID=UPI001866F550|nr:hypothetical protein [Nisaea sediminum]
MPPKKKGSDSLVAAKPDHIQQYDQVVEAAQLIDVRLNGLTFNVDPDYYQFERNNFDKVKFSFEGGFNFTHFDKNSGTLVGEINWKCVAKHRNKNLLKVDATYVIAYGDIPPVSDDPAKAFLTRVGKFTSYPYFRTVVSQLSWNAEANIPILPVLKK